MEKVKDWIKKKKGNQFEVINIQTYLMPTYDGDKKEKIEITQITKVRRLKDDVLFSKTNAVISKNNTWILDDFLGDMKHVKLIRFESMEEKKLHEDVVEINSLAFDMKYYTSETFGIK